MPKVTLQTECDLVAHKLDELVQIEVDVEVGFARILGKPEDELHSLPTFPRLSNSRKGLRGLSQVDRRRSKHVELEN